MRMTSCFPKRLALPLALLGFLVGCTVPPPAPPPSSATEKPPLSPGAQQTGSFPCSSFVGAPWEELWIDDHSKVEHVFLGSLWRRERRPAEITWTTDGKVAGVKWDSRIYVSPGGLLGDLLQGGILFQQQEYSVSWGGRKPTLAQIVDCLNVPSGQSSTALPRYYKVF